MSMQRIQPTMAFDTSEHTDSLSSLQKQKSKLVLASELMNSSPLLAPISITSTPQTYKQPHNVNPPIPIYSESSIIKANSIFDPKGNKDEIALAIGDSVRVDVMFQDGWCVGINLTTNQRGYFPFASLGDLKTHDTKSSSVLEVAVNHTSSPLIPHKVLLNSGADKGKAEISMASSPLISTSEEYPSAQMAKIVDLDTPINSSLLAILAYEAVRADELTLVPGDRLTLVATFQDGWGQGRKDGVIAFFPLSSCIFWNE
ncbi:hypothetical protein HK096_011261 [Nowakowskiella sp. JEL0078]|nr:hypothetical protein HK096_011261 [Nowakowskiella sp. JEL0078]